MKRVVLALALGWVGCIAQAQTSRAILGGGPDAEESRIKSSPLEWSVNYGGTTNLVEETYPRLFTQSLSAGGLYHLSRNWALAGMFSSRFITVNGQVDTGYGETFGERFEPSVGLMLMRSGMFSPEWQWRWIGGGIALLDEASRLEGYQGIPYTSIGTSVHLFKNKWLMDHDVRLSEVINSYAGSTDGRPNPTTSLSYRWFNFFRVGNGFSLGAGFGLKMQRYMDGFLGYEYNNSLVAFYTYRQWNFQLAYINGGFVDEGYVSLWFVDQYRRLVSATVSLRF